MKKFYLTTAIAYVNAPPHIGHALEFIQADALARYHRLIGDDVYFLTGTDEHGVKIYETAKEKGQETQALVDENAEIFLTLKDTLSLSNDDFIRTTEERHKAGARKLWKKMVEAGDIYKDVYKGNYCIGCEAFIPEKDLDENGFCPNHKKKPEILEEENYFFKLSKYSDKIRELIESDQLKIVPESRKNEMLNIIGEGLHDVSFSRPKDVLPWGIEVPDDESQVMYVWCDALSNYITAIGYEDEGEQFGRYWPCDAHIIGKDILRFHAGVWIGMLLSAGITVPRAIYVHGFVTSEGHKMSKSLGNVVDPLGVREEFGVDALRYYLLREIPTTDDGDFSQDRFKEVYNSELANSLGNLVNRVVMMTDRYIDGEIGEVNSDLGEKVGKIVEGYRSAYDTYDIKKACEEIVKLVDIGNKYIDEKRPWEMAKVEDGELIGVLSSLVELLRFVCMLLYPILPDAAGKIAKQIGLEGEIVWDEQFGSSLKGGKVKKGEIIFPRIED